MVICICQSFPAMNVLKLFLMVLTDRADCIINRLKKVSIAEERRGLSGSMWWVQKSELGMSDRALSITLLPGGGHSLHRGWSADIHSLFFVIAAKLGLTLFTRFGEVYLTCVLPVLEKSSEFICKHHTNRLSAELQVIVKLN